MSYREIDLNEILRSQFLDDCAPVCMVVVALQHLQLFVLLQQPLKLPLFEHMVVPLIDYCPFLFVHLLVLDHSLLLLLQLLLGLELVLKVPGNENVLLGKFALLLLECPHVYQAFSSSF